ncbi:vinorine synthase-like [Durio zibethinus]|uniref:Vinorine synthase-like n=1 Tax=Durio zibethinus TaxID=66656 RepID=A0A6P5YCB7_DURZI|nr:vinorine synthase-like [Durio zibethinus]
MQAARKLSSIGLDNMEVKIISRETIKPSSPTPHHLRIHKLSLLDQIEITESIYIPVILFYSVASGDPRKRSNILKESLSKTLTQFYPFAGRVKDSFSIDCNDEGVSYTEAQVATNVSVVLQDPEIDLLLQLLPNDSLERLPEPTAEQVLVAIQVNFFACGGMAICACVDHVVADGAATATFIKSWAAIACGANYIDHDVIYDCTSVFPPHDLTSFKEKFANEDKHEVPEPQGKIVTKRLLFDGSKITALRNEIGNGPSSYRPSRFEAVSALIWSAMLSTTTKNDRTFSTTTISMNLRNRTNPPMPQQCIGNVYQVKEVESLMEKTINLSILAGKIHETIRKVDDDHVKKLGAGVGAYINLLRSKVKNNKFLFVSWCRFPFYETDFGWGKPIWFATALRINRVVFFLDTRDGEGIEAWITLTLEEMAKFEQDPGVLAYSFSKLSK